MKQTVNEAASEYMNIPPVKASIKCGDIEDLESHIKVAFKNGAEWQAGQSPWISVKERLPYDQEIVLVRSEYGGKATAYYHGRNSGFITYGEEAYKVFGEVTQWMPIPDCEDI